MRLAEELDTTWQIHLSETEEERQNAIKEFGCSPVEYLAKLGCLNERTIAVHCVALSDRDIELLAESGASVVHCPVSNMRRKSRRQTFKGRHQRCLGNRRCSERLLSEHVRANADGRSHR